MIRLATEAEELVLIEKRMRNARSFDALPCLDASLKELSIDLFKLTYLPTAIDEETLQVNNRDLKQQLASLRLSDLKYDCPTNAGILLLTTNPKTHIAGAYVQYVKFEGITMSKVLAEKSFSGTLIDVLKNLSNFIEFNIVAERPERGEGFAEKTVFNYPYWSLRELAMNAVMHRNYESNAPIYIYDFWDRIEIHNAGSLYGNARPDNFPNTSDYRNPIIAEAMKNLKHVNRFNYGVKRAQEFLLENGNPPAEFKTDSPVNFVATIKVNKRW
jgi:ATP-dependent DNA helicase RecG